MPADNYVTRAIRWQDDSVTAYGLNGTVLSALSGRYDWVKELVLRHADPCAVFQHGRRVAGGDDVLAPVTRERW